jgi:hypothetical protein
MDSGLRSGRRGTEAVMRFKITAGAGRNIA